MTLLNVPLGVGLATSMRSWGALCDGYGGVGADNEHINGYAASLLG